MEIEKNIDVLNDLVIINNDRIEGYETAAGETEDTYLKGLFNDLKVTSEKNLSELRAEIKNLGGEVKEGTRTTGKFFRVWMDVKAALTGNDKSTILDSCEFGEDKALEAYDNALEGKNDFGQQYITLIQKQRAALHVDHNKVKALRDAAKK